MKDLDVFVFYGMRIKEERCPIFISHFFFFLFFSALKLSKIKTEEDEFENYMKEQAERRVLFIYHI